MRGDDAPRPAVDAGTVVDGEVDVPTDAAAAADTDDPDVPLELLATCDGPDGPEGCVRWVQRAGIPARAGTDMLVSVVTDQVVALDPATGRRRWSAPVTTPAVAPAGVGDHTVLVEDVAGVRALDAEDGDERWRLPDQHLAQTGPSTVEPEVVVLDDLHGTVTGVAATDGAVQWSHRVPGTDGFPVTAVPLRPDRLLVAASGSMWMLDPGDGHRWWHAGVAAGGSAEVPVAATADHVVSLRRVDHDTAPQLRVRSSSGRLLVDDASSTWERVRQLVITDGQLVLHTPDELLALDLDTGDVAWRRAAVRGFLVGSRTVPLPPARWIRGHAGAGAIATRSWSVVVLGTDGTGTVLDPRTGREARTFGEPTDGLDLRGGFLTRRHLWRRDATSLEVIDLPSLTPVLRIEVRAPPTVVSTDPVVVATSGRLVGLDVAAPAGGEDGGAG